MLEGPGIPSFESHGFDGFRERAWEHTFKMRSPRSPPGRALSSPPSPKVWKGMTLSKDWGASGILCRKLQLLYAELETDSSGTCRP